MTPKAERTDPVLVPFGPTRPIPAGRQWCMACDGEGQRYHGTEDTKRPCDFCAGQGHWGAEDVRRSHERDPERCREECGAAHREWTPPMTNAEFEAWKAKCDETDRKIKALLGESK